MSTAASRFIVNAACHLQTAHFAIHHDLRDPSSWGVTYSKGVRDLRLIAAYADSMNTAWEELLAMPLPFEESIAYKPIRCMVTDLHQVFPGTAMPFCTAEIENGEISPFIALPSCYRELVDWPSILDMARCAARHEPAHAWAYRVWGKLWSNMKVEDVARGIDLLLANAPWLTEGHAVAIEAGDAPDGFWLQHAWVYCDRPGLSLFDEPYACGLFSRYLDRYMGWQTGETFSRAIAAITTPPKLDLRRDGTVDLVEESAAKSDARRIAWSALDQVIRPRLTAEQAWIEACRAGAYIGGSTLLADEEPAVFARYGRRAVSESFALRPGESRSTGEYSSVSLSCRYFRLDLDPAVSRIRIIMPSDRPYGAAMLRVGMWLETDARIGHWFASQQEEWLVPAAAGGSLVGPHWHLVCALVPHEGGRLEASNDPPWTITIEAR